MPSAGARRPEIMEVTMTLAVRSMTRDTLPPILPIDAAPVPALLPAGEAPTRSFVAWALLARAVEAAGLEPFVRLARLHPTLFQGIALPIGALLVMCLVMGGLPAVVIAAYFLGCGMILSRRAVKDLLAHERDTGSGQLA
jgi:hypothetical protein